MRGLERGLRRRRLVLTAAIGAGLLGVTAAVAIALGGGHDGPNCRLAAAEVERAWNPAARAQLTTAFTASTRSHAGVTLERVISALDHHAETLRDARVAACEATHVRGAQSADALDRRMACLDQRIDATSALVTLFGRGVDDELVDRAYEAVINLPAAADCARPSLVERPLPPPGLRQRVDAARTRLDEAEALRAAGRLDAAGTAFTALATEAKAIGYAPFTAEVLAGRARTLSELGDAAAGKLAFQEAATAAAAAADDHLIAEAWVGQLGLLAEEGGKPADALERLAFAEVAVARADDVDLREEFLVVRSDILGTLGRFGEARTDLETARTSLDGRGGADTILAGRITSRLASVLWQMGENEAALDLDRQTLALWSEKLGGEHPKIGQMLNNLAIRLEKAGHYEEALRTLERALVIKETTLGPEHPSVAFTLHNLGLVHGRLGHRADSVAFYERTVALREKVLGPDHQMLATTLSNLAGTREDEGRLEEALALFQRAAAIHEKVGGPDHPYVAGVLSGMSDTLLGMGRLDEAMAAVKRSIAIREKAFGKDGEPVAQSLMAQANIYLRQHRHDEACAVIDRALAITLEAVGPDHPDMVGKLTGRAHCRVERGDVAGAIEDAERAIAVGVAKKMSRFRVGRARFILARALYRRPAERARAAEQIALLRADFATGPADIAPELADIEKWIKAHPLPAP